MSFSLSDSSPLRLAINHAYRADENLTLENLLKSATLSPDLLARIHEQAYALVEKVRAERLGKSSLDAFLVQYDLGSQEGIALMCLSEALLRIPDNLTMDKLIKDKVTTANWALHAGQSPSFFVNAATWGLMLTGKIFKPDELSNPSLLKNLKKFIERSSEPVVRNAILQAIKILGKQFVMGRTIDEALSRAQNLEKQGYRFSYDMLGEAACTQHDADRYFKAYMHAIEEIGKASAGRGIYKGPGISVKLSALTPRYTYAQPKLALSVLVPKLLQLSQAAKAVDIGLSVDAEETERLDISLDIFEQVIMDPSLQGWDGLGLVVQAYQKRAFYVLDWVIDLAKRSGHRINIRLVKGAYWDAEIKLAQTQGLDAYPIFTRKAGTDVSYIACARKLLAHTDVIYPQFATHNAYSVAAVVAMAGSYRDFEFQCLHGMGYTLYDHIVGAKNLNIPCRVYAPVGSHEDLLAYLVRRLLENGANTSFVNRIVDQNVAIDEIIADPVLKISKLKNKAHPNIPLPRDIYPDRKNSRGVDFANFEVARELADKVAKFAEVKYQACPIIGGKEYWEEDQKRASHNPADMRKTVGYVCLANEDMVEAVLENAMSSFSAWSETSTDTRAQILEKAADLLEQHAVKFMALLVNEAGKTLIDANAEVREAIDFCRYYAAQARIIMKPHALVGPTGESNVLSLVPRGPIMCISPWNFPLAIFMGQITAALVVGNTVIAKPSDQTCLVAAEAVRLLHDAGVPAGALQLFPGKGSMVGKRIIPDQRIKGVVFTGSTETAQMINQTLAQRGGQITPFIAETGGQNCMIVDSSALPEQVVFDVINSAFMSAGQRCSALRVLYLQDDIADKTLNMLTGAMRELVVSDPCYLRTDIGPVIDKHALHGLEVHAERMRKEAKLLCEVNLHDDAQFGSFFAPCAFEIPSMDVLTQEVFGPVLHVVRFKASELGEVLQQISSTGYGLTLGIHSRIESTIKYIVKHAHVGNIYVNRNMIGAVVGVQPFGGEGLSGTGPKAGGPHYLPRLCTERTLTINTTAAGGNASLLSLSEQERSNDGN